jgi:hypothetical protein
MKRRAEEGRVSRWEARRTVVPSKTFFEIFGKSVDGEKRKCLLGNLSL